MATAQYAHRNVVAVQCAMVALWMVVAIGISIVAIHLSVGAVRDGDLLLADTASGLTRMASSMAERGIPPSEITSAIGNAAKTHGLDVTVQSLPQGHVSDDPAIRPPDRSGFHPPAPGIFGDQSPWQSPSAVVHVADNMVFLRLSQNPLERIIWGYALSMFVLTALAIALTWRINASTLRRVFGPVATIESALRRLAGGEYSRLAIVGHEPGEAAVVDAYNAAADELAASIRMRAEAESNLRQFAAEAGHELRTPLTVIMGFVDVLRQGAIAEPVLAQRILDSVAAEGERMRSLIARLLLLARLDAVAPERHESVDLSQLVSDTVESFRPLAGETRIASEGEGGVSVIGSASELREIVGNLVDNAIKYAPGAHVRAKVERNGRFAVLTVADDGPGMAPALRARAFDRFSRGDERGSVPGSGLGLAIVKRIVVRAGGEVDLESAPGKGTTVRVQLPLAAA